MTLAELREAVNQSWVVVSERDLPLRQDRLGYQGNSASGGPIVAETYLPCVLGQAEKRREQMSHYGHAILARLTTADTQLVPSRAPERAARILPEGDGYIATIYFGGVRVDGKGQTRVEALADAEANAAQRFHF